MTICWIFFFFALSMFFSSLGEDISAPLLLRLLSLSRTFGISLFLFFISFFSEKKQKKKKKQNSTKQKKRVARYCAHSLFLSLSLSLSVLRDIKYTRARRRTHARRAKGKSNFFVSSLEELSEVKKRNAVGCFYLYTHIVR